MKIRNFPALLGLSLFCFASAGYGHGYIDISRGKLCRDGLNSGCGSIVWEPQSLEGPDRFPGSGPADGQIASAGVGRFSQLNEQSPTRWHKTDLTSGAYTFNWSFTAVHRTRDWRYFITLPDWNPSLPLSRDSFDLQPFCSYAGGNQVPPRSLSHSCTIPDRNGYHVILAVWDVGDTANSFYNVIDVNLSGGTPVSPWVDIGDINPTMDLDAGDSVLVRLFDTDGELFHRNIEMEIASTENGLANTWPKLLAEHISAEATDLLAGIRDSNGEIVPSFGKNDIFADRSSSIVRAEVELLESGSGLAPEIDVTVSTTEFTAHMPLSLDFSVTTNQLLSVTADLYYQGVSVGHATANIQGSDTLNIGVADPAAGDYQLVVTGAQTSQGGLDQETVSISVIEPGTSEYTYPQGRGSYTAGTVVTGEDGNIYECLIAGWCNGWPFYYAPGRGLAWQQAWKQTGTGTPPTPTAEYVYPDGRGQYESGTIVEGRDGNLYRCDVGGWCNSASQFYYAPGTGLAWSSAWTAM